MQINKSVLLKKWSKSILIGLIAGLAAFFIVQQKFYIPIPGTTTHTDPREIFTILGSALGGVPASLIIAFLAGIAVDESARFASIFAHILSALFVTLLYNYVVYKLNAFKLAVGWLFTITANLYLVLAPGYLIGLALFTSNPPDFLSTYLSIINGAQIEFLYTIIITTAIILALPKNLRKPIFTS